MTILNEEKETKCFSEVCCFCVTRECYAQKYGMAGRNAMTGETKIPHFHFPNLHS
ncbi:MAG: hypothetical protein K6E54_03235 [Bacteroidaceae bacterium]|nr:hypothetical protein [Bacteroidaceae bacterium]